MLKDVEDTRVVSWLKDDIVKHKPSDLDKMLETREAKISKQCNLVKKSVIIANQCNTTKGKDSKL